MLRSVFVNKFSSWAAAGLLMASPAGCADGADRALVDGQPDDVAASSDIAADTSQPDFADEAHGAELIRPPTDSDGPTDGDASLVDLGLTTADGTIDSVSGGDELGPRDAEEADDIEETAAVWIGPDAADSAATTDTVDVSSEPEPSVPCRGADPQMWRDLSGYGHHGEFFALDETVAWSGDGTVTSPFSLELGGTPDPRLELPAADAFLLVSGSVEFWLRAASTTFANKMVYNHRDQADFAGVVLISQAGQWKGLGTHVFTRWATAFAAPGHQVGIWQHIVLTWEYRELQTTLCLFIDGVESACSAFGGPVFYGPKGRPQIGGLSGGSGSFHGGMAMARIWGGALKAAEVRGLYNDSAAQRFGRAPRAGEVAAPRWPLLGWFDATPCE